MEMYTITHVDTDEEMGLDGSTGGSWSIWQSLAPSLPPSRLPAGRTALIEACRASQMGRRRFRPDARVTGCLGDPTGTQTSALW